VAKSVGRRDRRKELLDDIASLADVAIFGTFTETYRTCGTRSCRCHHGGPKHGPHVYVSYREAGKTASFYVPAAAKDDVKRGIEAWQELQRKLRELADLNKEAALETARLALAD
jgi:hypothetical protein